MKPTYLPHQHFFLCACCLEETPSHRAYDDPELSLNFCVCQECHANLQLAKAHLYAAQIIGLTRQTNRLQDH